MHYHCEVWLPESTKDIYNRKLLEVKLNDLLAPYSEDNSKEGFYDWFEIGGRWTGDHTGYDPYDDIANKEICYLCAGTGTRKDMNNTHRGCNGCSGTGVRLKNDLTKYEKDVLPVKDLKDDFNCYTLVAFIPRLKKPKIFHNEVFKNNMFVPTDFGKYPLKKFLQEKLKIKDGYVVTVDYHLITIVEVRNVL